MQGHDPMINPYHSVKTNPDPIENKGESTDSHYNRLPFWRADVPDAVSPLTMVLCLFCLPLCPSLCCFSLSLHSSCSVSGR